MRVRRSVALSGVLVVTALALGAASTGRDVPDDPVQTFSILGFEAEAGVGAVATQAIVDVSYGPDALALMRQGMNPAEVVKTIWERDPDPEPDSWTKSGRQFAVMDAQGNVAAYTGPNATAWAGHKYGRFCSAQGNILAGEAVVDNMVKAFEETKGYLSERLMAALDAGQAAGGDTRGMQSAAMLIVKKDGGPWLHNDVVLRLQVDDSDQPLEELRRLVNLQATRRQMRGR